MLYCCCCIAQNAFAVPHILVLNSYHSGYTWSDDILSAIKDGILGVYPDAVLDVEYMDSKRYPGEAYRRSLVRLYGQKFRHQRFDLVFVTDDSAFQLAMTHGASLFQDAPIIFCGVNYFQPDMIPSGARITGVVESYDIGRTLTLALAVQPYIKRVVVINDKTLTGRSIRKTLNNAMAAFPTLSFEILPDFPLDDLEAFVSDLARDTIVLFLVYFRDNQEKYYEPSKTVRSLAEKSSVPLYGVWDFYMGQGLMGGMVASGYLQGETVANLGLQVLAGKDIADIPVVYSGVSETIFDYRQLAKHEIALSRLPASLKILNRPYGDHKNVLILHSYNPELEWTARIHDGIFRTLKEYDPEMHIFTEYMDTKRHWGASYLHELITLYQMKYHAHDLDLIICSDDNAYNFASRYRKKLFGDIPLVFCAVNSLDVLTARLEKSTGVLESYDIKATLEVAFKLYPGIRKVLVINDVTTTGKANIERLEKILPTLSVKPDMEYLQDCSMADVLERVATLEDDTVILLFAFLRDHNNRFFSSKESCRMICSKSRRPVFAVWDFYLGEGIVGGMLTSGVMQGKEAARLALEILEGQDPESLPISTRGSNTYMFDDNVLRKYHLNKELLPASSTVINKQELSRGQYRLAFGFTLVLLAVFIVLVGGLGWKNCEHKRRQKELEKEALTDPLTGALNRRSCLQCIDMQIVASKMSGKGFSMCYVDLDDLKHVNDSFGHYEGDRYILLVSDMIQQNIRNTDALCRIGGDEFIVVFPSCALADARNIWDKIQTKIIALNDSARYAYHISVSVGFTFFEVSDPKTAAELIAVADTNMYQGKMETRRDTNGR